MERAQAALEAAEAKVKELAASSSPGSLAPLKGEDAEMAEGEVARGEEEGGGGHDDAWDEEEDLPEDAILVGEKLLGKDWRSKCWWEERQVGRVRSLRPLLSPRAFLALPSSPCSSRPGNYSAPGNA